MVKTITLNILVLVIIFLLTFEIAAQDVNQNEARRIASAKNYETAAAKRAAAQTESDAKTNAFSAKTEAVSRVLNAAAQKPFTLREAVEMAIENNPDLEIARQNVRLSEYEIKSARGFFDPVVSFSQDFQRLRTPATNFFGGSLPNATIKETALTNNLRVEKPLARFGTIVSADLATSRRTTNNPFETFTRNNQSDLRIALAQPLLRGRATDEPRRRLEAAKKNLQLSDKEFRERAIAVIERVRQSYWDLAFALKNLKSQEDNLRDTKLQLESVRRRIEEGSLAPVEAIPLERQIASLESAIYNALDDAARRENALKNLIVRDENAALWNEFILPVEDFEANIPLVSLADALRQGAANRIEISKNQTAKEVNEINQKFNRDRLKPQIDLTASYNFSGFAGTPNANLTNPFEPNGAITPPPAFLTGNYFDALGNLARNRFNTFQVGVTFSFPVGNQTAKAELGKSLVEAEKIATERRQINQNLQSEIRTAWTALENAKLRVNSTKTAFEAATREYESEKRKFEEGYAGATTFNLLQRQIQKIQFENEYIGAQINLRKAASELERATGVLAETSLK